MDNAARREMCPARYFRFFPKRAMVNDRFFYWLGRLFYEPPQTVWDELPTERGDSMKAGELTREEFLEQAEPFLAEEFLYYRLKDQLPAPYLEKFKQSFLSAFGSSVQTEIPLQALYRLFEENSIRFAPIKGIDLAWRIYPSPALRRFSDWDILFHPEDCQRATELLFANGWTSPHFSPDPPIHHHYAPFYRGRIMLEPHRALSRLTEIEPAEVWEEIHPVSGTRHALSPELYAFLLERHACADGFRVRHVRYLLDAAFLMVKTPIQWDRVRHLARRWHLPYPGNFFGAYAAFFPKEILTAMNPDPVRAEAYRQLIRLPDQFGTLKREEWSMQRYFSVKWVRHHLGRLSPRGIRNYYNLPAHGAYGRLIGGYFRIIRQYAGFCFHRFALRRSVKRYQDLLKLAEGDNENART